MIDIKENLKEARDLVDPVIKSYFSTPQGKERVIPETMSYSTFAPAKRLRPYLVLKSAEILGLNKNNALNIAAAIEMTHTYSLIHDDLPAMDDDDYRRGQLSAHKKFGEANAILAGDALLTKAFEVIASDKTHPDSLVRTKLVAEFAKALGEEGMIAGQALDIALQAEKMPLDEVLRMNDLKTGKIIRFALIAPAIATQAEEGIFKALEKYAYNIGIIFQITDDILDMEEEAEKENPEINILSVAGLEKAKQIAERLTNEAKNVLENEFGDKANELVTLADFILKRTD
jgi:geranylgeranyl pyrophosphate synthase